jgi:hypothetical protein
VVRPLAKCLAGRRSILRVLNVPYWLVDAGRQWQLVFEVAVGHHGVCDNSIHAFVLFNLSDCIVFLVGKVVDDVIIARNGHFVEFLGSSFGSGRSLEMVCAELPALSRAVPQDGDELNGMENFKR